MRMSSLKPVYPWILPKIRCFSSKESSRMVRRCGEPACSKFYIPEAEKRQLSAKKYKCLLAKQILFPILIEKIRGLVISLCRPKSLRKENYETIFIG